MDKKIDIVLLGATGYTGRLCAAYMSHVLPENTSWAIAGRSADKLKDLHNSLDLEKTKCTVYALDLTSDAAISELAKSARVVINTIGPYATTCGTAVIKACAENGTDYVDWYTSSSEGRILAYTTAAAENRRGCRIIMTTGWAAVPADVSVYLAVLELRNRFSLSTREALVSLDEVSGSFSGGSLSSVCSLEPVDIAPFDLSPVPRTNVQIVKQGVLPAPNAFGVQTVDTLGALVESTHSLIETAVVGRSWGLYAGDGPDSLDPEGYGGNFFFSSRMKGSNSYSAWAFRTSLTLIETAITKIPSLRYLVARMFPPGTGPSEEARKGHYFKYRVVAIADEKRDKAAPRVEVKFEYDGDPYVFTGVALTQAALTLLQDDTPAHRRGGILTPAALGETFAERLKRPDAGIKIEVIVQDD
ncbi:hypothetical protein FHETE_4001 [Fusarium heterosporum]|uniref:Saccharopine dehydrogenase NADP binding domain-containing protein n=1 Tax=Fusarium heterosporum TaxID=42747 RepID=A0A8H5TLT8_FUSHE|nr:hypothetical protein FHETE_4001 [Fusarium heterosporum]